MEDKKKAMIIGGLLVVLLGVGAFQMMAPAPAPVAKKEKKDAVKTTSLPTSSTETETGTKPGPNSTATDPKDPANGEAKVIKPGAAMLDENGRPITPPTTVNGEPVAADGSTESSTFVASARDPFDGRQWAESVVSGSPTGTTPHLAAQPPRPQPNPVQAGVNPGPRNIRRGPGIVKPMQIPDFNAGGGGLPDSGSVSLEPQTPGAGPIASGKMPSIEDVQYTAMGAINGKKKAAVLRDSNGQQRLVRVGEKIDGDTEVVGVRRGEVIVRHRGKTKVLRVDQPAEKPAESGNEPPKGNG